MSRTKIIAQLDAEISRLERARDFLAAALKNRKLISSKSILAATRAASTIRLAAREKSARPNPPVAKVKAAPKVKVAPVRVAKAGKPPALVATPVAIAAPIVEPVVVAPSPQLSQPQVHRVPPKRRVERRQAQAEKGRSAALGGLVPAGPVAVSANEARKQQERNTLPAPTPSPAVDLRKDANTERSLGSLIQAFERRSGVNRIEIP
jgi:hypothetical protein